jgi:hypothetical protein
VTFIRRYALGERVPGYRLLLRTGLVAWVLALGALAISLFELVEVDALVYAFMLAAAATLTIAGAVAYLQETAITPVREAFIQGYKMASVHAAEMQANKDHAGVGRVLRFPTGAYAIGELATSPTVARARHRAPSPRRSPRR